MALCSMYDRICECSEYRRLPDEGICEKIFSASAPPPHGETPPARSYCPSAIPIWRRLAWHWMRLAASRARCTAGSKSAISTAMTDTETSSSTSVNARPDVFMVCLSDALINDGRKCDHEDGCSK